MLRQNTRLPFDTSLYTHTCVHSNRLSLANWSLTIEVVERKKTSLYLLRITSSYLSAMLLRKYTDGTTRNYTMGRAGAL